MTAAWIIRVMLASGLVFVSAMAFEHVAAWSAKPRRWLWLRAIVVTTALTVVSLLVPRIMPAIGLEPRETAPQVAWSVVTHRLTPVVAETKPTAGPSIPSVPRNSTAFTPAVFWIVSSGMVFAFALTAALRLAYVRRRARRAQVDGVEVLVTTDLGPLVTGIFNPVILVPAWTIDAAPKQRTLILQHEQQHIAGGDHWVVPLAALAIIAMPWNPFVWMMYARLRLAIETDCDARVIALGADKREYGEALIRVAGSSGAHIALSPAWSNNARALEHRVRAMTQELPRARALRSLVFGIGGALMIAAACDASTPDSARHQVQTSLSPMPRKGLVLKAAPAHSTKRGVTADATGTRANTNASNPKSFMPVAAELAKAMVSQAQSPLPGVVRVTGFTKRAVRTRVHFDGAAGRFVMISGQVLKASVDSVGMLEVEFDTPADFAVRGAGKFRVVATSLEPAEVEIMMRSPSSVGISSASARGPSPGVIVSGIDDGDPLTAPLREAIAASLDSLELSRRADADRSKEREQTLEPGQIRVTSQTGEPMQVEIRTLGRISVSGRALSTSSDQTVSAMTPFIMQLTRDEDYSIALSAPDTTQILHVDGRGGPGFLFGEFGGRYPGSTAICGRVNWGGGIGRGIWRASAAESCAKVIR